MIIPFKRRVYELIKRWNKLWEVQPIPPSAKWISIFVVSKNEQLKDEICNAWAISSCLGSAEVAAKDSVTSDIALVDLDLPLNDGVKAIAEIRRKNKRIPVIGIVKDASLALMQQCIAVDMTHLMLKPFRITQLEAILTKHPNIGKM